LADFPHLNKISENKKEKFLLPKQVRVSLTHFIDQILARVEEFRKLV